MAVKTSTELATVSASRRFGEAPSFQRKFVVEVDDPTTTQTVIVNSCNVKFLDSHPEALYAKAMNVSVANYSGSRWHYEVTWDYELPKQANAQDNPLVRPDIWRWSTGGLQVPALYYFDGTVVNALVNSAGDFFEGATTDISTLQASITSNRATFDYALATALTNTVNSDAFLGSAIHTWKCSGISGTPQVEVVNDIETRYWQIETTLEYRPDGWPLQLPDVGWNYLDGSDKKRVVVKMPGTNEEVASSNPQPLNTDGTLKTGAPNILIRRVHREIGFSSYFGTPS